MDGRQIPWKPSQPAMASQLTSCRRPRVGVAQHRAVGVELAHVGLGDLELERGAVGEPVPRSGP